MRIALIILHADAARGGAERYTIDLHASLRAGGHDAFLIASTFANEQSIEGAVRLESGVGTRSGRYLEFLDQLDRHLAAHPYDVAHAMLPVRQCDVYHPHAGIAAEAVSNGHVRYEGPVMQLLSQMANRMNRRRQRFAAVERALLTGRRPPMVICLSDYVKRELVKHYPMESSRLARLFNAVDLERFDPDPGGPGGEHAARAASEVRRRFGIDADKAVALMIAQDFGRKGLAEAIGAVARVNDPKLVLLVVGKQDPRRYRELAKTGDVADRVIFAGPTTDPPAFYRAADFFILPTRHDPCSLVVLEALAMGLPVISTACNGACEIMESGKHGFVLQDPADTVALANSVRRLMNASDRASMSQACLTLRPALSYPRHLEDLLAIYTRARATASTSSKESPDEGGS